MLIGIQLPVHKLDSQSRPCYHEITLVNWLSQESGLLKSSSNCPKIIKPLPLDFQNIRRH
ncbi:hypothetical protein FC85_GL002506 [Lentilactobacillus diolivorans DSM 14421]|uniref:Uncharacterized protein n=1 Tax=Lentilactobacillus diolivorans DSM 14421 TaxID=1423739 RepID=A0A0R1SK54_9LACO|nr:hypothetical protein FC85_GL002506 [Lentilactobacillus diolivorans DSM 14421]